LPLVRDDPWANGKAWVFYLSHIAMTYDWRYFLALIVDLFMIGLLYALITVALVLG
jgi:hypothetical protein